MSLYCSTIFLIPQIKSNQLIVASARASLFDVFFAPPCRLLENLCNASNNMIVTVMQLLNLVEQHITLLHD